MIEALKWVSKHRSRYHCFSTTNGYFGKDFFKEVQEGDLICILFGCPVPVALRRIDDHYEFVRVVYVDSVMFGEAMDLLDQGEVALEVFELH